MDRNFYLNKNVQINLKWRVFVLVMFACLCNSKYCSLICSRRMHIHCSHDVYVRGSSKCHRKATALWRLENKYVYCTQREIEIHSIVMFHPSDCVCECAAYLFHPTCRSNGDKYKGGTELFGHHVYCLSCILNVYVIWVCVWGCHCKMAENFSHMNW